MGKEPFMSSQKFRASRQVGRISSFVLYSRKFGGPINAIAEIFNELFSALAAAERVFALLDEDEDAQTRLKKEYKTLKVVI